MRAAAPSAARTRARWAFWTLIGVNVVMLWFFVGMSASVTQHARVLDEDTLEQCASVALSDEPAWAHEVHDARFVGEATVRFTGEVRVLRGSRADKREVIELLELECTVRLDAESDRIVVQRAEVLR